MSEFITVAEFLGYRRYEIRIEKIDVTGITSGETIIVRTRLDPSARLLQFFYSRAVDKLKPQIGQWVRVENYTALEFK